MADHVTVVLVALSLVTNISTFILRYMIWRKTGG